jgi:hypothetical protein
LLSIISKNFLYSGLLNWAFGALVFKPLAFPTACTIVSSFGWFESVFVPAGVTVRARAQIKLAPGFSGTFPRFEARDVVSGTGTNQLANAGGQYSTWVAGGAQALQFSAAATSAYETKELTIAPVAFSRYINIGVHVDSSSSSEGCWMKNITVLLDRPYAVQSFSSINGSQSNQALVGTGNSLTQRKLRLGGRLK